MQEVEETLHNGILTNPTCEFFFTRSAHVWLVTSREASEPPVHSDEHSVGFSRCRSPATQNVIDRGLVQNLKNVINLLRS